MSRIPLSTVLLLDALTCAAVFVLGVFATAMVAALTGLPDGVVSAAGWICLVAAALLAFLAARPVKPLLLVAIAGNVAWVVASIAVWLSFADRLTPIGHAVVLAQAAVVALFVVLESRGLKSLGHTHASPASA